MQLTLTVAQLEAVGACKKAIADFRAHFGADEATREWTAAAQMEFLRSPLGKYIGWAAAKGLLPLWSMTGADLTWANLTWANLTGANLTRADLTWANLTWANLTGADLTGANLTGANLTGADLTGADLTGADLTGADLTGAHLTERVYVALISESSKVTLTKHGWRVRDDGFIERAAFGAPVAV